MLPLEPQHATHSAQLSRLQRSSQVFQLDLVGHVHFHSTGRPSALDFDPRLGHGAESIEDWVLVKAPLHFSHKDSKPTRSLTDFTAWKCSSRMVRSEASTLVSSSATLIIAAQLWYCGSPNSSRPLKFFLFHEPSWPCRQSSAVALCEDIYLSMYKYHHG